MFRRLECSDVMKIIAQRNVPLDRLNKNLQAIYRSNVARESKSSIQAIARAARRAVTASRRFAKKEVCSARRLGGTIWQVTQESL
jgi:hypothetical protein